MARTEVERPSGLFAAPALPALTVARGRLVERFDAAVRGKLTVVVAPPGWGKSTLVAQWARGRRDRVVWLSSRPEHDVRTFASMLNAALGALGASEPPTLDARISLLDEPFLAALLEQIETLPESYVVLERADRLDPALQDGVARLIERSAGHFHVVVTTRSTAVFSPTVDRLRLSDEVAYIRARDLAFDRDAARMLLQRTSGRLLSNGDVDALVARTEGWATALQFAALSLRDECEDASFVAAHFGGDDPRLAAYCRNEMFAGQSESVRRFLTRTSVLDGLTGSLCDAVTGDDDGLDTLRLLEQESLIDRVEEQRFRYHPLWREVLRHELRARERGAERRLLEAAAQWHLARDEVDSAAGCLIAAQNWERLIALVDSRARSLFEQGRAQIAIEWLDQVPAVRRMQDRRLLLQHAVLLSMAGHTRTAEHLLRALGEPILLPVHERVLVDALRASWVEDDFPPERVIEAADDLFQVVDLVDPGDLPSIADLVTPQSLKTVANGSRARAHWQLGDVRSARKELHEELSAGDTYLPWRHSLLGALGLLEATTGRLTLAEQHARHALRVAAETGLSEHASMVDANLAMAHVLRERNSLDTAALPLRQARVLATEVRRAKSLAVGAVEQAHLDLARGRPDRGLEQLERFRAAGHGYLPRFIAAWHRAMEARLLIAMGEHSRAERVLAYDENEATPEIAGVAAQLALGRHDVGRAKTVLESWPEDGEFQSALTRRMFDAVVVDIEGDRDVALERLAEVVRDAEPEGHVGLFADAGAEVQHLLRALFQTRPSHYLKELVRPEHPVPLAGDPASDSAGGLSMRELLVLRYLPSRLTNAEIAEEMFVSLNTVKTYVKSIYAKLGVNTRSEAIVRAEELGIV